MRLFAVLVVAACGHSEPAVECDGCTRVGIADHADPLTFGTEDRLFSLRVLAAPGSYALAELSLQARTESGRAPDLDLALDDEDGDLELDAEVDALIGSEPGMALFDPTDAGRQIEVSLALLRNGVRVPLALAIWLPAS